MAEAASQEGRPLDDVMMAMDVVDTLRHRQRLVHKELGSEAQDDRLIERLRAIYAAQGIEVPDRILREGVTALKQQRFAYTAPAPGITTSLIRMYVSRRTWGVPLLAGLAVLAVLWIGYEFAIERPREAALERQAVALSQGIPNELAALRDDVLAMATADAARSDAVRIHDAGIRAAAAGDIAQAQAAVDDLGHLQKRLAEAYEIRVVSRPDEPSGIWRVPDANPNARNYYLIVEAVAAGGDLVPVSVTSEEDGQPKEVTKWAMRVSEQVFAGMRDDKTDDGIIQNNLVGIKRAGDLEAEYRIPVSGGAIFDW